MVVAADPRATRVERFVAAIGLPIACSGRDDRLAAAETVLAAQRVAVNDTRGDLAMNTATVDLKSIKTFAEFYPLYLKEHANRTCRRLHFVGSSLALACLALLIYTGWPGYALGALVCGYGFAWVGHFGFEKNRPASFKRPLYSFMGDWVMYRDLWTGRIRF